MSEYVTMIHHAAFPLGILGYEEVAFPMFWNFGATDPAEDCVARGLYAAVERLLLLVEQAGRITR